MSKSTPPPPRKTSAQFKKEFDNRKEMLKGSKFFPCEAPGYVAKETKRLEHKMSLSFVKLDDDSCDVFADIHDELMIAKRIEFDTVEPFQQDTSEHTLFNVPYETLVAFAKTILEKNE